MQANETLKSNPAPMMELPKAPEGEKKGWVEKLKIFVGDTIRDVATANDMAKDKFDGNTAFMQMARGGITIGIGVGLERILDETWEAALRGDIKLLYKPDLAIPQEVGDRLRDFGKNKSQRGYYFIREASKDILNSIIFNGLAFFSRPMLQSVEGKHLVRAVLVDAGEAILSKNIPKEVGMSLRLSDKNFGSFDKNVELEKSLREALEKMQPTDDGYKSIQEELFRAVDKVFLPDQYEELLLNQGIFRKLAHLSSPPTQLGLDMLIGGGITLWKNIKEVKKVRKEKGGLEGKKVFMPQENRRREYGGKPQYNKDKVYYGKSNWKQEEEDRAKFS